MSKDQRLYLQDILERIDRLEQIAAEGETVFRESFMHQDSAIRNFEVIGEIIKRLDSDMLAQQPQINWRGYTGFRDILIHQYDKVIVDVVWESTGDELAALKLAIEALIAGLSPEEPEE